MATASIFALALSIAAPMAALAASADNVVGTFTVKPSGGVYGGINFQNSGGVYGGSTLYDNGDFHVGTDNLLFLDAPVMVNVSNALSFGGALRANNINNGTFNGSQLYDNANLHIATDDAMYFDATSFVFQSGATF
ncbi:MAG: hypothetical protein Q8Q05_02540, partial [bacterium]|nr:hypothetical protein [bacterium]